MGKPENKVESKFKDGIKALGGKAYKFISPGSNGVPDRIACLPNGRVIFVELKSPNGTLSKQQRHRIAELHSMKQEVYVLQTVQQVEKFLTKIREELMCSEVHTAQLSGLLH